MNPPINRGRVMDLHPIRALLDRRYLQQTHFAGCEAEHVDCAAAVLLAEVERGRAAAIEGPGRLGLIRTQLAAGYTFAGLGRSGRYAERADMSARPEEVAESDIGWLLDEVARLSSRRADPECVHCGCVRSRCVDAPERFGMPRCCPDCDHGDVT